MCLAAAGLNYTTGGGEAEKEEEGGKGRRKKEERGEEGQGVVRWWNRLEPPDGMIHKKMRTDGKSLRCGRCVSGRW